MNVEHRNISIQSSILFFVFVLVFVIGHYKIPHCRKVEIEKDISPQNVCQYLDQHHMYIAISQK